MAKDLLDILIEKQNKCRNLQRQAFEAQKRNDMIPNEEQCEYLQLAADLEFEMSTLTRGAEKEHHIREKNRLDYEIMKLREYIDPKAKKKTEDSKSIKNESAAPKNNSTDNELDGIAKTWHKPAPKHAFDDVSGMSKLKKKLQSCIEDKKAQKLTDYLKIPRMNTYFFVGPPGCGKTYIIEAFAHELLEQDYEFISIQGSDIISRYVGEAEKKVTRLFEEIEECAPCIVFIDEIDSLCKNRSLPNLPEYAANITTEFLTGFNRIHSADSDIVFIAATNYPNRVDVAMLDRAEIVRVPLPDLEAREAALKSHFEGIIELQKPFTYHDMALKTKKFNYRDIERLSSAIKRSLFRELVDLFDDSQQAIDALSSGKYQLTRSKVDKVFEEFASSPKETILNDLKEWEKSITSVTDIAIKDLDGLYEGDEEEYSLNKTESDSSGAEAEAPKNELENKMKDPVCAAKEEYYKDPESGAVEISFYLKEDAEDVLACISGENYDTIKREDVYCFWYTPDQDEEQVEVYVRVNGKCIGSFTAFFGSPIKDNTDFDI